jgi:hypothetical protein
MKNDKLISALQEIRDAADKALRAEGATSSARARKSSATKVAASDSLPDHILHLRDTGFLKNPKTIDEVHLKLQGTYHCNRDRVSMALLRLLKRKMMRKTQKVVHDKKQTAYVW